MKTYIIGVGIDELYPGAAMISIDISMKIQWILDFNFPAYLLHHDQLFTFKPASDIMLC